MRGLLPVYGSRFEVRGSRFEVRGSGFAVRGLRFGVCGFERFNKLNAGLIRGIGFEVPGSRFEVFARPGGESMRAKKKVRRNTFHNRNTKEKVQGSHVDFPPRRFTFPQFCKLSQISRNFLKIYVSIFRA